MTSKTEVKTVTSANMTFSSTWKIPFISRSEIFPTHRFEKKWLALAEIPIDKINQNAIKL